ncbi:GPN-loop GTPase 3 [Iris pallida]|uniref:GPN-loop GTPase 3 n=1 Tax=Iris pallida TaxID=29817 RepID=A0AAX6GMF2_IRIPA|nr:GPN-loop GTPase 3 [Iris pallida]
MIDVTKYISGCMASLFAIVQLELPHVNILSKWTWWQVEEVLRSEFHGQPSQIGYLTCILCFSLFS